MNQEQTKPQLTEDGLVTPTIGRWGEHKYLLVRNYARIFAMSMKQKWDCRVYIDLFAGAGRSRIAGTPRVVLASPLLVLEIPDRFDCYLFCEKDEQKLNALRERVQRDYAEADVQFVPGDSNLIVDQILSKIPKHTKDFKVLCFCFADPYKLKSLHFSTIERLSERFMDFLILIPTGMDAKRNLSPHYLKLANETIDKFLGTSEWRQEWQKVELKQGFDVYLTNRYGQNMMALGYHYRGIDSTQLIRSTNKNLPLYRLGFFSRHKLGEKFWREAKTYSDPQIKMFR